MLGTVGRPLSLEKWVENLFRPTVIAGMMASVVISAVALVRRADLGWGGTYLVCFAFLVVWEAIQSERVLKHSDPGRYNRAKFRFTEWVLVMILLKFAAYAEYGLGQLLADVPRWSRDLGTFFDGGFVLSGVLVSLLWQLSIFIAQDLYILEVHPSESRPSSTSSQFYLWITRPRSAVNRGAALRRIMISFFWGGLILVICTGFARYDIPLLFPDGPPPVSGLVLNAMLYFLLGLVLISQAYYSVLQARWQLEEVEVDPQIGSRWAVLAAIFLIVVVTIALVLPTGYSMGLPQAIATAINMVVTGMIYVVVLVLSVLVAVINAITSLIMGRQEPIVQPPDATSVARSLTAVTERGSGLPMWGMLRDFLLWALLLGIVTYSFYNFLGDRRHLFRGLFTGGPLAWIRGLLMGLFGFAKGAALRARKSVAEQLERLLGARGSRPAWRYVSLSSLDPRMLIMYFYLSVVRRANDRNITRRPWQTPYEYSSHLRAALPELESEVEDLTDAFVQARYGQQHVTEGQANVVKRSWRRIRSALRRWRMLR